MKNLLLFAFVALLVACSTLSDITKLEETGQPEAAWAKAIELVKKGNQNSIQAIAHANRLALQLNKQKETTEAYLATLTHSPKLAEPLGQALAQLGEASIEALIAAHQAASNKAPFATALLSLGPLGSGQLAKGLNQLSWKEKNIQIALIARYQSRDAAASLLPYLGGDATEAVEEGLLALRKYSLVAVREAVENNSLTKSQKAAAARVLGEMKNRDAIPTLEKLALDPDPLVRSASEKALSLTRGF